MRTKIVGPVVPCRTCDFCDGPDFLRLAPDIKDTHWSMHLLEELLHKTAELLDLLKVEESTG